jgi:hypothetical protein
MNLEQEIEAAVQARTGEILTAVAEKLKTFDAQLANDILAFVGLMTQYANARIYEHRVKKKSLEYSWNPVSNSAYSALLLERHNVKTWLDSFGWTRLHLERRLAARGVIVSRLYPSHHTFDWSLLPSHCRGVNTLCKPT